jgi:hypothetical protein
VNAGLTPGDGGGGEPDAVHAAIKMAAASLQALLAQVEPMEVGFVILAARRTPKANLLLASNMPPKVAHAFIRIVASGDL